MCNFKLIAVSLTACKDYLLWDFAVAVLLIDPAADPSYVLQVNSACILQQ